MIKLFPFLPLFLLASAAIAETRQPLNFNRDIRPILSNKCFACHGPDSQNRDAGYRLDTSEGAFADLGGYAGIVPGEPDASELVLRITNDDVDMRMPPQEHKNPLTDEEIDLLTRWIEDGAEFTGHWAFEPIQRPEPPATMTTTGVIDRFIAAQLEQSDLGFSPEASPETLVRRLYLDLTGLPPTLAQVDAFLKNPELEYETTIDHLMDSPQFAERMAMEWLYVARFADTNGYSIDDHRDMWAWRDWVIQAFQNNLPYDEFIRQQLAGDLMDNPTEQQKIATGFLRNSMNTHEGGTIAEEYRVATIIDKVDTVATAFMGLTMRCAQCHDHKYDPISQRDYYRFFAFFNTSTEPGKGGVNGNTKPMISVDPILPDDAAFRASLESRIASLQHAKANPENLLGDARQVWERETLAKADASLVTQAVTTFVSRALPMPFFAASEFPPQLDLVAALRKPDQERSLEDQNLVAAEFGKANTDMGKLVASIDGEIDLLRKSLASGKTSVMVMNEDAADRLTPILMRGQYDQHGEIVDPGIPEILGSLPPSTRADRLALADWLIDPDHPLTARVAVNRYWQMLFGTGIVKTSEDFGSQGEWPSHPELLDWLAAEFLESDWNVRDLLKRMLMSRTYRQSSNVDEELLEVDPYNRLYARAPRFRLSAEAVRDSELAIAGLLKTAVGGPSVYPPQPLGLWKEVSHFGYGGFFSAQHYFADRDAEVYRRSLYMFWKRTSPPPVMTTFDAPSRETCTVRRSLTNTPLQALVLMNAPQFVEASRGLAMRMLYAGESVVAQIGHGFRLATARNPSPDELEILSAAYERQLAYFTASPNRAASYLGRQDSRTMNAVDSAAVQRTDRTGHTNYGAISDYPQIAAMSSVASLILNLDETITRE